MSEQGLAARALAALVPSRRRAATARSVRTVADLVRDRAEEATRAAAGASEGEAAADAEGPAAQTPDAVAAGAEVSDVVAPDAVGAERADPRPGAFRADSYPPSALADAGPQVLDEMRPVARSAFAQAPVRRVAPRVPTEALTPPPVIAFSRPGPPPPAGPPTVPSIPLRLVPARRAAPADDSSTPAVPSAAARDELIEDAGAFIDDELPAPPEPEPVQPPAVDSGVLVDDDAATRAEPARARLAALIARVADAVGPEPDISAATGTTAFMPSEGESVPARATDAAAAEPDVRPARAADAVAPPEPGAAEPPADRPTAAVPDLLPDAELMEALGEDEPDDGPEPRVVAMTTAASARPPTPPVRAGSLAPPWVRAALMGAEPRTSATPEQAAATRALRRTFGVPQDPGPVTLAGVDAPTALAVLLASARTTVRSTLRPVPRTIVGAPVPVRYRVVRRDGAVVGGAEVAVVDPDGATVVDGLAGPDGCGRLVVQQPGQYMLVGAAPGFQPGAVAVNAVAGTVDAEVLLVRSASVRGVVRLDGEPVPAVQITLVQDGEVVDMVETGPSGQFRITELTGGEYALAVAAEACPPAVMVLAVPEEADLVYDVDLASPSGS